MSEATPRFVLPFILPGQAQKELFHNEALVALDIALQASVESGPAAAVPSAPAAGACWIVGAGAAGAWSGKDDQLAMWTEGGWRFCAPTPGMNVWNKQAGLALRWTGGGWNAGEVDCSAIRVDGEKVVGTRQPAVPSPSGGTIIDVEARAAIDHLIATLKSHGLID